MIVGEELRRPVEEEALFNPAFIAHLLHRGAKDHEVRGDNGLPLVLAYLIAPLALHRPTREALPSYVTAQMGEWIDANPALLVDLPERARALRTLVSAAVHFGLRYGVLRADNARLLAGSLKRRPRGLATSNDVEECLARAAFLGRWFADQGDPVTTLALWGLRA